MTGGGTIEKLEKLRILDVQCSTGAVSRALVPYASHVRGIDLDETVVWEYNRTAAAYDFPKEFMCAVTANLLTPTGGTPWVMMVPDFINLDLVVIAMGFHQVRNVSLALNRIFPSLKPGTGTVAIVDFFTPSAEAIVVARASGFQISQFVNPGFSVEEIRGYFFWAGYVDVAIVEFQGVYWAGRPRGKIDRATLSEASLERRLQDVLCMG
ncbi:MAG: hypothetical protein M1838_001675 [Thelocarpon superellum]|nr:MAG: hypothetical protein M1838_001675 [Thelocarpon superellum]